MACVLLVLERFLRAVLGEDAKEKDTMFTLLEMVMSRRLIRLPFEDQMDGKDAISDCRNSMLHGNYAQAATRAACPSVTEYFRTRFAFELECMWEVVNAIVMQIDTSTGDTVALVPNAFYVRKVGATSTAAGNLFLSGRFYERIPCPPSAET